MIYYEEVFYNMIFKDERHEEGYNILTKLDSTNENDFQRKSFFYIQFNLI